jgi:hypothetical protein
LTADPDGMIKHNCARGNRHGLTSFERSLSAEIGFGV